VLVAREILKVIIVLLVEAVVDEAKKYRDKPSSPPEPTSKKGERNE